MLKNTASQNIAFLLIDASDGSALTGATVSGYVTKDGGSQAGAAGTISEKANGVYNYAPTQAETDADSISFLFTATGAIPVNLQVFTIDVALFKADVSALATAASIAALNNLSSAQAQSAAAAALAAYDPPTKAELDAAVSGVTVTGISSAAIDSILDEPITEPAGVFTWAGATLRNIIGWLGALNRNKLTQTSSVQTLRNDADDASIATADLSDDGTTATRGEWE